MYIIDDVKKFLIKEKKALIISLCGGIIITCAAFIFLSKDYSEKIQSGIADSVVRFHVIANSDNEEDQKLKIKVRDAVLNDMNKDLNNSINIEETVKMLEESKGRIKTVAENVVSAEGYNYSINVELSHELFPLKTYGDVVFPAGIYNALRIDIGKAEGKNWWCVMFPPLCFVDGSCNELTDENKNELKKILSDEEYAVVVSSKSENKIVPKLKFKIVEWWQEQDAKGKHYIVKK